MHRGKVGIGQLVTNVVVEFNSSGGAHYWVNVGHRINNVARVQCETFLQSVWVGWTVRKLTQNEQRTGHVDGGNSDLPFSSTPSLHNSHITVRIS